MQIRVQTSGRTRPIRPNPAETIATGQKLGADDVQKDLFALTAGVAGVEAAPELAAFGKTHGSDSWQQGAFAVAAGLAGGPAIGAAVLEAVRGTEPEAGTLQGFLAVATASQGPEGLNEIRRASKGLGQSESEEGLFAVAAGVAGVQYAEEAIGVGLAEGRTSQEQAYYALATAVTGDSSLMGPLLSMAGDYASSPDLRGPYALAASLAGRDQARSVLRMAEDLGQTSQEKAAFSLAGGLVGVERAPGFVRMARALAENEAQVPAMTVAAALTGGATPSNLKAAVAGSVLFQEG